MKKYSLFIFLVCGVLNIVSQFGMPTLEQITKPLLMISLALYYVYAVSSGQRSTVVLLAILFSWVGDVLLMFQHSNSLFFILGLGSFLVSHVFYIRCYQQHQGEDTSNALNGVQRFRFSLPIILAGTGLITVLYTHLGDLKIPVIVYALVLILMVLNALFRSGRTNTHSFLLVFFGAVLFMISDSLIAINKFLVPVTQSGLWIMTTYIAAQYLIIKGLVKHE